jgi:predicted secreted protein
MGSILTYISIYLVVWWTVLFAVLPIGVTSHHEAGLNLGDGGDPGAPVDPKLKRKFLTTTWVSAIIFAIFWVLFHFHVIRLPWTQA